MSSGEQPNQREGRDQADIARLVLSCLDLTSLNDDDTPERIDELCDRALDPRFGVLPASVCVYPRFVAQAARRLAGSGVGVATVINFPHGGTHWDSIIGDTRAALADGATEIDFVIPFRAVLINEMFIVRDLAEAIVAECHRGERPARVKAILETGALEDAHSIKRAAQTVIAAGVDFIKTSTGKVPVGATPEAAETMLEAIGVNYRTTERLVGLKVSGGVRTVADAAGYIAQFEAALPTVTIGPDNFRVGASGIYNDIAAVLSGAADGSGSTPGGNY